MLRLLRRKSILQCPIGRLNRACLAPPFFSPALTTPTSQERGRQYVQGGATDLAWLTRLPDNFTLCSATRSAGGRVLTVDTASLASAWFHGHNGTLDGVAAYGTSTKMRAPLAQLPGQWVWVCASNAPGVCTQAVNGALDCIPGSVGGSAGRLAINPGNFGLLPPTTMAAHSTAWGVYEVLVFSGGLSNASLVAVSGYLQSKYALVSGAPPAPAGLPTQLNNVRVNALDAASYMFWHVQQPHRDAHPPAPLIYY